MERTIVAITKIRKETNSMLCRRIERPVLLPHSSVYVVVVNSATYSPDRLIIVQTQFHEKVRIGRTVQNRLAKDRNQFRLEAEGLNI